LAEQETLDIYKLVLGYNQTKEKLPEILDEAIAYTELTGNQSLANYLRAL
jgi:hypothetical protein